MGIKGLPKLIQDEAGKKAIKSYDFSRFIGNKVSVDASLIIHQTVIAMRSSGRDLINKKGELTSHLQGLFYKVLIFLQHGIIPIFIFEGKTPSIKNKTVDQRKEIKRQAEKRLEELSDSEDEEYIKLFKQTFRPTGKDIKEAQILLDLMGIPYITAPGEADIICAWLAAKYDSNGKRYVKGVCSDDSDMLAFGAPYLFKNMAQFMNKKKQVQVISLERTLKGMHMSMQQFVDMCALGAGYCNNIAGIGLKTAYKLIKKNGSLEKMLKNETEKYNITNDEKKCFIEIRNYYRDAFDEIDNDKNFTITDDNLTLKKCQYDELIDFMCMKHNFDIERIQPHANRLVEYNKKMNITQENNKKPHKMLVPKSKNYLINALSEDIDFISSEDEDEDVQNNTDDEISMPSKKTSAKNNVIKLLTNKLDEPYDRANRIIHHKYGQDKSKNKQTQKISRDDSEEPDMSISDFEEMDK